MNLIWHISCHLYKIIYPLFALCVYPARRRLFLYHPLVNERLCHLPHIYVGIKLSPHTFNDYHGFLHPNLLLLQKSMVIIEGVWRQLYPDIDMWEVAKPLIYKWMLKEKASPGRIYSRGKKRVDNFIEMATDVPYQVHSILSKTLSEELKIGFVHHRLETLSEEINILGRRFAMGMIIAALIIGSSFLAMANKSMAVFWGMPAVSWGGFIMAGVFGLRMGWSRFKRDKK